LLKNAFLVSTIHSSAVRANPLVAVLKRIKHLGLFAEVASEGVLNTAVKTSFNFDEMVLDSPVKTKKDTRKNKVSCWRAALLCK